MKVELKIDTNIKQKTYYVYAENLYNQCWWQICQMCYVGNECGRVNGPAME